MTDHPLARRSRKHSLELLLSPQRQLARTPLTALPRLSPEAGAVTVIPILQMKELRPKGSIRSSRLSPRELVVWAGPPQPHLLAPSSMVSPS